VRRVRVIISEQEPAAKSQALPAQLDPAAHASVLPEKNVQNLMHLALQALERYVMTLGVLAMRMAHMV
jgi:hypothetical protein